MSSACLYLLMHTHIPTVADIEEPAIERAYKLKRVYTETELRDSMPDIPRRPLRKLIQDWEISNERRKLRVAYKLESTEAKKLVNELNITHEMLTACYQMPDDDAIDNFLCDKGITSKALRTKLTARIKESM